MTYQEKIEHDVKNIPIVLYMKGEKDAPMCRFSMDVVRILNELGADFEGVNVLEDDELREEIKIYSDWPTLPQLYIGGEFIGGRDIVLDLHEQGELQNLLPAQHDTE